MENYHSFPLILFHLQEDQNCKKKPHEQSRKQLENCKLSSSFFFLNKPKPSCSWQAAAHISLLPTLLFLLIVFLAWSPDSCAVCIAISSRCHDRGSPPLSSSKSTPPPPPPPPPRGRRAELSSPTPRFDSSFFLFLRHRGFLYQLTLPGRWLCSLDCWIGWFGKG